MLFVSEQKQETRRERQSQLSGSWTSLSLDFVSLNLSDHKTELRDVLACAGVTLSAGISEQS